MDLLKNPMFWLAVIVVCLVTNWAYSKFVAGKGKLL